MRVSHNISDFVARWAASPFGGVDEAPWHVTQAADAIIRAALDALSGDYLREGEVTVRRSSSRVWSSSRRSLWAQTAS
jgi:hypothetical protein